MTGREFQQEINKNYLAGSKLANVKLVKEYTGLGLKEAKELVDQYCFKKGNKMPGKTIHEVCVKQNIANKGVLNGKRYSM